MKIDNFAIFTDGVMTGTTTINSDPIYLGHIANFAVQLSWVRSVAALVGTYKIQVSNSPPRVSGTNASTKVTPPDDIVWSDLTSATGAVVDAASGNALLNYSDVGYLWARLQYTNTTGTGALQARANLKGI